MLYNISMKKISTREFVLKRSRDADKARIEALKESDGAGDMVKTKEDKEVNDKVSKTSQESNEKKDDASGE